MMDWLREILSRCAALLGRKRLDHDLDDELGAHLELAIAENVRRGMTESEARTAALRAFGGQTQIKETYRVQRGIPFLEILAQDLRYAARRLRASPGFTAVAVITLALGIGANTAIFTLVQGILLRSLPVADPSQLYRIGDRTTCCYYDGFENETGDFDLFSYDLYRQFKQAAPEFEQLAAVQAGGSGYSVRAGAEPPRPLRTEFVSGNYFAALGIGAYVGRVFTEGDDQAGAAPVLVISYRAWESDFARDPAIVGSIVYVQTHPFIVAGIAPPGFFGDRIIAIPPDFWMPLGTEPVIEGANSAVKQSNSAWLYAVGRVRSGVDLGALQEKLSSVLRQWMHAQPSYTENGKTPLIARQHVVLSRAGGGIQMLQHQTGASLRMLMILSSVVLLIACANIANLLLARSASRTTEVAMRMALGAGRSRLIRQVLTESVLLSLMGGAAGLAVAYFGSHTILALAFPWARNMPVDASPSLAVLGFALLVSVLTGVVFGTAPAWVSSHAQPAQAFRGTTHVTRDHSSLPRRMLVVFQLALSIVLLAGTFLMTKSLRNLQHQNFGIDTAQRYTLQIDLEGAGYKLEQLPALYREIEDHLTAIPGLARVSFARYIPLGGNQWGSCVIQQGHPAPGPNEKCFSDWDRVSAGFLDSIGVPVVRGRGFTDQDTATSEPVVVVNQAFAKMFFHDQDPIGQHFGTDSAQYSGAFKIIGVSADFEMVDARGEIRPLFLRPITQRFTGYKEADVDAGEKHSMFLDSLIVQFASPQQDAEKLIRKKLAEVDPKLPVFRFAPYDAIVAENFTQDRLIARLTSAFGFVALLLASVGLYGVMSYSVARRTSEIGIRMAIGATRSSIVQMVLRGAVAEVLAGLAFGIPASLYAGHLMSSLLYQVSGFDLQALAGAAAVLGICAGIAAIVPALRAASIDPMRALRTE
jgi:macrolide transport system ATP-binding/permease protein